MNSVLIIKEPIPFYSEGDEEQFFKWLQSIPALKHFNRTVKGLKLTLEDPIDKLSLYELIALATRYNIDRKCLRNICNSSKEISWFFKDKRKYWYKSIFKEEKSRASRL